MTWSPKNVMFIALLVGIAATALVSDLALNRYPPTWQTSTGQWGYFSPTDIRSCMGARLLTNLADRSSIDLWNACAKHFWKHGALDAFVWRYFAIIATSAFTLVAAFGFALAVRFGREPFKVVRGRRLLTGANAERSLRRATKLEARRSGIGLELVPGLAVSRERETRHWLIWGSVGAGKTQTMTHLILGAIDRGDGVLVIDVKGDMTAGLHGNPLLIAPQDARSLVWDIARDCRTKQDARELASRLIPDSHDPMWSEAAREILVVCLATLMATKSDGWSWADLHQISTSSAEALSDMARKHHVDALRTLANPENRTTQSVLSTFQTHMNVVATLAEAWGNPAAKRFAISEWLHAPTPFRAVILQHDPRYPGLSSIWIGGMLTLLASAVGSPSLAESSERRIWIFADEFPQLPRIANFSTFLDLGRSKGVVAVLCAQDLAQLRATYGHERAEAWVGMIGTKIITKLNVGHGADEASKLIGDQEIEREERSETFVDGKSSVTTVKRRDIRLVITASEITTKLGPRAAHIDVLIAGIGDDALLIRVPYVALPKLRPGHVPAAWVQGRTTRNEPNIHPIRPGPRLSKDAIDRIRDAGD